MVVTSFSKIVIAGGGIVGNSIAYYLAKRYNTPVTIIDPVGIAPAASGKAGGFLAKDWSDGTAVSELQRRSFDLHVELGKEFGKITDYRRLTCAAVAVGGSGLISSKPSGKKLQALEWADVGVLGSRPMGDEKTIAQVHPRKLCRAMFDYAQQKTGTTIKIGRVIQAVLEFDDDEGFETRIGGGRTLKRRRRVAGVKLESGEIVEADALVVACGPWTGEASKWFQTGDSDSDGDYFTTNLPAMYGTKYHSILIKSQRILSQAVFFQGAGDPEVYPRPDGDAYITGFPNPPVIVQDRPGEETIEDASVQRLLDATKAVSTELGCKTPHTVQCCYLPTTNNGVPIIGTLPGKQSVKGAFVAAGHSCWGILNGPATGEAMAELLVDGDTTHVDLSPFSPSLYL